MNKRHLVKVAVTNYFDVEVLAPDEEHIYHSYDPEFAKNLRFTDTQKLIYPEDYCLARERKVQILGITEVLSNHDKAQYGGTRFASCTQDLEKEIFSYV